MGGVVHLREDSLSGDELDGTFDLLTTSYSLLHPVILSGCGGPLGVRNAAR